MPANEIDILGTYLCCPDKFHFIHTAINSKTSVLQLTKLRDQLRSRTGLNRLHYTLEREFEQRIEQIKQQKNKGKDDARS